MRKPAAFAGFFYFLHQPSCTKSKYGGGKEEAYPIPTNDLPSFHIQTDQITCSHKSKVLPQWIHPDVILEFGISHGYVARHPFCKTLAGEIAEDRCSMDEDVGAVLGVR